MKKKWFFLSVLLLAFACRQTGKQPLALLPADDFDTTINNVPVALYTLKGGNVTLQVTNFGGRVVTLFAPDKNGKLADVVLGRNNIRDYAAPKGERFLGACVGPVANRIGGARFVLNDTTYTVPANDHGVNTLHGGFIGLDMVPWDVVSVDDSSIVLHYLRPDGQEGYPGNLDLTMKYTVTSRSEFRIDYTGTTDHATPVNLSNHPFFNLRGEGVGDVLDYVMYVNASRYTPIDSLSIPLGENEGVEGTPFDFRTPQTIGARIDRTDDPQIRNARGYDHNWVLDRKTEGGLETACTVWDPLTGRFLEVLTDQPGIQFYSGNFFNGSTIGKYGEPLGFRASLALETQHFPDSPNRPNFPSVTLNPGERYTHTCVYRFSVKTE